MAKPVPNRKFVYSALEKSLRGKIFNGDLDFKLPIPGEEKLAKEFGISRPSARKAIQALEREGLLKRTRGGGTYVVPPADRSKNLVNKNLRILIGIAYLDKIGVGEYNGKLLEGASEYAFRAGHVISYFDSADFDERRILNKWREHDFDAIIWTSLLYTKPFASLRKFHSMRIPQLILQHKIDDIPYVRSDTKPSLNKIITFLHNYGHSKIGFVNCDHPDLQYDEMETGYFEAMREITGEKNAQKFYLRIPNSEFEATFRRINGYFDGITALILGGYTFLLPFLNLLQNKNINIPKDLSLLCMDDTYAARCHNPPITVYSKSRIEQGKQMIHIAESLVRGGIGAGEEIVVNGELIVRESCDIIKTLER